MLAYEKKMPDTQGEEQDKTSMLTKAVAIVIRETCGYKSTSGHIIPIFDICPLAIN